MIKLLKIELLKVKSYRAFWFMLSFYGVLLAIMIFGIPSLIDYIAEKSGDPTQFRIFKAVVFNFPDIWQNISFVASWRLFIKVILGIIIIILVTSEYSFLTIRANIINGISRKKFLLGKISVIILLGIFSTLIIFLSGLYLGLTNSVSTSIGNIFGRLEYLLGYFLEVVTYMLFCLLISLLFKKTGITFIAHIIYLIVEPILDYKLPDAITPYLPMNAMNRIIQTPNTSLIKVKTNEFNFDFQEFIDPGDVAVCMAYAAMYILLSYWLLRKRDL